MYIMFLSLESLTNIIQKLVSQKKYTVLKFTVVKEN